ncbi:MAG: hypothetical protein GF370_03905 [Candidatus Nealsonbacteria bacterium]|nr:hypothetical protein [Candidatus Nealsonbacteria bacterium]
MNLFLRIFLIFSLTSLFFSPIAICFARKADASAMVHSNPVSTLAQEIQETKELLSEKEQEYRDRKNQNVKTFLFFLQTGGIVLLLVNFYKISLNYWKKMKRSV